MIFDNKTYDILKKIAFVFAPLATFVGAVCIIWGVPFSEQITATLAALNTFLGALLGKSSKDYHEQSAEENEVDSMGKGDEHE